MNRTPRSASRRASRQLAAKVPGLRDVGTVQVEDVLRFVRDVGQLGHRRLHAIGHLVLGDPRGDLGIVDSIQLELVELGKLVEHFAGGRPRSSPGGLER